jgi:hypothetical protein
MGLSSTFYARVNSGPVCCRVRHALKAAAAGQAWKYPVSYAAGTVLDGSEFHSAKFENGFQQPASQPAWAGDMADKS